MIRRAQAEALLKLAEALEECERNGVSITHIVSQEIWVNDRPAFTMLDSDLEPAHLRMAIAKLYPKSEAQE